MLSYFVLGGRTLWAGVTKNIIVGLGGGLWGNIVFGFRANLLSYFVLGGRTLWACCRAVIKTVYLSGETPQRPPLLRVQCPQ